MQEWTGYGDDDGDEMVVRRLSQSLTEDCPELAATPDGEEQYLAHHLVRAGGFYAGDAEAQVHAQAVDVTPATHPWN